MQNRVLERLPDGAIKIATPVPSLQVDKDTATLDTRELAELAGQSIINGAAIGIQQAVDTILNTTEDKAQAIRLLEEVNLIRMTNHDDGEYIMASTIGSRQQATVNHRSKPGQVVITTKLTLMPDANDPESERRLPAQRQSKPETDAGAFEPLIRELENQRGAGHPAGVSQHIHIRRRSEKPGIYRKLLDKIKRLMP